MSEIRSISTGSYTIGQTSNLNFEAGTGIKITEPSEGTVRIANDETVLWSNSAGAENGTFNLSESYKNFEKLAITHGCKYTPLSNRTMAPDAIIDVDTFTIYGAATLISTDMLRSQLTQTTGTDTIYTTYTVCSAVSDTQLNFPQSLVVFGNYPYNSNANIQGMWKRENSQAFYKIIGINRISGGNE